MTLYTESPCPWCVSSNKSLLWVHCVVGTGLGAGIWYDQNLCSKGQREKADNKQRAGDKHYEEKQITIKRTRRARGGQIILNTIASVGKSKNYRYLGWRAALAGERGRKFLAFERQGGLCAGAAWVRGQEIWSKSYVLLRPIFVLTTRTSKMTLTRFSEVVSVYADWRK